MSDDHSREELEALLELQDADQVVKRIRHKLDHLDEQQRLDEAQARVDEVEREHADVRVELDLIQPKVKKLEDEIALLEQRKADEAQKLYGGEITNPRELQGMRAELESTQRRIGEHEDALLEVMEQAEAIQSRLDEFAQRSADLQREVADREVERDAVAKDLLAELAEAEVARDEVRSRVPDDLVERYDEEAQKQRGLAIGRLVDGMCTGCRIDLPRVEVSELRQGPPVTTCPECGRILIVLD